MPQLVTRTQRSFASGEISPLLYLRPDLARFATALALCRNFVALPWGGATARSGSRFIYEAPATAEKLIGFQFSDDVGYILEFSNQKMRVYKDDGIVLSMGNPFELATSFLQSDLANIDHTQSADVLYIVSGRLPEKQIRRLADDNWQEVESAHTGGPFRRQNTDESHRLYITTALPGSPDHGYVKGTFVTLKATEDTFTSDHVGALFLLREEDRAGSGNDDEGWQGSPATGIGDWIDHDYSIGAKVRVGDAVYVLLEKNGTGFSNVPPSHTEGEAWAGSTAAGEGKYRWRHQHNGFGIVKITGYTGPREVTALVQSFVPDSLRGTETGSVLDAGGSHRWAEGAWSKERGYPKVIGFHEQRKVAGHTDADPITLWFSVTDDFQNMAAGDAADEALIYTIASNRVNPVRSLVSGRRLAILTGGEEWAISGSDSREPITPSNVVILPGSDEGAARVKALKVGNPVFVAKDGRRVMELAYDFNNDNLTAGDLSIFSEHLLAAGVKELAWQREPYRILWCLMKDGELRGLTFNREQEVIAWHRHEIAGGTVRSIAVKPAPDGAEDELWLLVDRTIDGDAKRYVERLEPFFQNRAVKDVADGWFFESALHYDGTPVTTVSGLAHLEGETVEALADGKAQSPQTVTGGQITLPEAASKITVGLPFEGRLRSLPVNGDGEQGSVDTRNKRASAITVHVTDTAMGTVAPTGETAQLIQPSEGLTMGEGPPLFTGQRKVPLAGDWSREAQVDVIRDRPFPMTVLGLTTHHQISGGS